MLEREKVVHAAHTANSLLPCTTARQTGTQWAKKKGGGTASGLQYLDYKYTWTLLSITISFCTTLMWP